MKQHVLQAPRQRLLQTGRREVLLQTLPQADEPCVALYLLHSLEDVLLRPARSLQTHLRLLQFIHQRGWATFNCGRRDGCGGDRLLLDVVKDLSDQVHLHLAISEVRLGDPVDLEVKDVGHIFRIHLSILLLLLLAFRPFLDYDRHLGLTWRVSTSTGYARLLLTDLAERLGNLTSTAPSYVGVVATSARGSTLEHIPSHGLG
mmetsp:Transcript_23633/g.52510  ORF Transcript_23633/g.52510 Transcript_23633/m.52510 type:complete len:203 (+) Transcript_23633:2291-2899(+)